MVEMEEEQQTLVEGGEEVVNWSTPTPTAAT
jgi:hypothetical protein